jgi:hypothetical protein
MKDYNLKLRNLLLMKSVFKEKKTSRANKKKRSRAMGGERLHLLESGEGRSRSTLNTALLPVVLAVLIAKSSFLAHPSGAFMGRTQLEQRGGLQVGRRLPQLDALPTARRPKLSLKAVRHERHRVIAARLQSLADPDEAFLRAQMGRGWTYRADARIGSGPGGGGMPLTASYAMSPEDLKNEQLDRVGKQRQFEDFVVDGRTGRPLELTDEQKKKIIAGRMADEAKEQEDVDSLSGLWKDSHVPSQYIYPDGESIIPRAAIGLPKGLSDKHVMANGTITEHQGPVAGVFREGAFGTENETATRFNKFGEDMGFTDRPLAIRDVDYEALKKHQDEGYEMRENETEAFRIARINGTEHRFYCSGKDCDDQWGLVGDQVVDLRTGEVMHEGVGPGDELSPDQEYWNLDRHFNPRTGVELNHCVGPQCHGYTWSEAPDVITDKEGPASQGHGVFGGAYPSEETGDPQVIQAPPSLLGCMVCWVGVNGGVLRRLSLLRFC